jgi:hypothetical protein
MEMSISQKMIDGHFHKKMPRTIQITDETKKNVVDLYQEGQSTLMISHRLNVSLTSIRKIILKFVGEMRKVDVRKNSPHLCYGINTAAIHRYVIEQLGGICIKYGFSDLRALQLDHKNGGGNQEALLLGRRGIYLRALKYKSEYQVLCANCNSIKNFDDNANGKSYVKSILV